MGTQLSHSCPTGTGTALPSTPYSHPRTGETGKNCLYAHLSTLWACFRSRPVERAVEPPSRGWVPSPGPRHTVLRQLTVPAAWQGAHQRVNILDGETDSRFLTCAFINIWLEENPFVWLAVVFQTATTPRWRSDTRFSSYLVLCTQTQTPGFSGIWDNTGQLRAPRAAGT